VRILAFGDSFVLGAGDPDHLGWVGRALAGRREVTLYNLGIRRETSADIGRRWRAEALPRMVEHEPMRLVFSFGANDCHLEGGAVRVPAARSLLNARAMLSEGAGLCPVLMVGPPPLTEPDAAIRVEELNEHLKVLCARLQVPFIDVLRPLAADGLWAREAAEWDGAHPGAAGYQRMADLVAAHPAWRAFTALS
jgi:acyl-CoA thioesterase-1